MMIDRKGWIRRERAVEIVEALIKRMKEVNSESSYCYMIEEAYIFGSYVTNPERDRLKDIDIAVLLKPRYPAGSAEIQKKIKSCKSKEIYDKLNWPEEEVIKFLKRTSRHCLIYQLGILPTEDEAILAQKTIKIDIGETGGCRNGRDILV